MTPLAAVIALAMVVGLLAPVLAFVVLAVAQLRRHRAESILPSCLACGGRLLPLLDGSHRFLGEAACLRCGRLHEGLVLAVKTPQKPGKGDAREAA